jgi:hypothetical protein
VAAQSNTAVIFATQNSNVEALEELISRGADVKANNCVRPRSSGVAGCGGLTRA